MASGAQISINPPSDQAPLLRRARQQPPRPPQVGVGVVGLVKVLGGDEGLFFMKLCICFFLCALRVKNMRVHLSF